MKWTEWRNDHYQVEIWIGDTFYKIGEIFPDLKNAVWFKEWIKKQKGFKRAKFYIERRETIKRHYSDI